MLLCYEDFQGFINNQTLKGTAANLWTQFFAPGTPTPDLTFKAYDDRGAVEASLQTGAYQGAMTHNNPNLQSIADGIIYFKPKSFTGSTKYCVVFRYGTSGGFRLYSDGVSTTRLDHFTSPSPFASLTNIADLDSHTGDPQSDIKISFIGATIKVYFDGVLISTSTVTDLSAGKIGVAADANTWNFDDFVVENATAGILPLTNLTATVLSATQIKLEWDNNVPDAAQILIEKKVGTGAWVQIDTAPSDATSYIDEKAACGIINTYRVRVVDNLTSTVYFQDMFEDVYAVHTGITIHEIDINRADSSWEDLNGCWEVFENFLTCTSLPDSGLSADMSVKNFKATISAYIYAPALFDIKLIVNQTFNFHANQDGMFLYDDATLILSDTTWVGAEGLVDISIEVNERFISVTIGSNTLKYYTKKNKDSYLGIGSDSIDAGYSNLVVFMDQTYSVYSAEATATVTTMTIQEIWERYSEIEFEREIYVKRINDLGVYESEWQNISDLINFETRLKDVCAGIQYALPNNTYSLGAVIINNASLLFANQSGQFSNEDAANSIFHNFVRHKSLIRVVDSFIDSYTYPGSRGKVSNTTFEGFIDDRLCVTNSNDTENIIATEVLGTLLKSFTLADLTLPADATIQNLVYAIMNRSAFTDFFTVSLGNIVPGFNATNIDLTQYDNSATIFELMQDLSVGHSIFYVRNGIFYYKSDDPGVTSVLDLWESPQRKIKFDKYNSGGNAVFDKLYWQDGVETYSAAVKTYNQSYAFSNKGINHPTQRQGLLDYAGPRLCQRKITFNVVIPFLPILFILDRITVLHRGNLQEGCFILDISKLDEGYFLEPVGSFTIEADDSWKIISIVHASNNQTTLTVEKII